MAELDGAPRTATRRLPTMTQMNKPRAISQSTVETTKKTPNLRQTGKDLRRKSNTSAQGTSDAIYKLIEEGFFDDGKTSADLRGQLHEQAVMVKPTSLPPYLVSLVRTDQLVRKKEEVDGKVCVGLSDYKTRRSYFMTTDIDLKTWLHKDISRLDKLLLILATFDRPCSISNLRSKALESGLRISKSWNLSSILTRSNGLAIRTPNGWEITNAGYKHLENKDFIEESPITLPRATELRKELSNVATEDTRKFVEEAIRCYELKLYRSAIVMSWISAVDVLHKYVHDHHLHVFNVAAKQRYSKWRPAKTPEDISLMREADFLDCLVALRIIGRNTKAELKRRLELRNSCSHPNSLKIGANVVAHHVEILLLNVFKPFCPD